MHFIRAHSQPRNHSSRPMPLSQACKWEAEAPCTHWPPNQELVNERASLNLGLSGTQLQALSLDRSPPRHTLPTREAAPVPWSEKAGFVKDSMHHTVHWKRQVSQQRKRKTSSLTALLNRKKIHFTIEDRKGKHLCHNPICWLKNKPISCIFQYSHS